MATETRTLASSTTKELELLEQQTAAIKKQAEAGQEQLDELREARFAEFCPCSTGSCIQTAAADIRRTLTLSDST